nr:transcription elongation factor GreA [Bordetella sp. LUAb4]
MATLHELQTVYGSQDLYDMLEVIAVDVHNETLLSSARG